MRSICSIAALLLGLGFPGVAGATTLVAKTAADLVDEAQVIFTGTAVYREVVPSKDGRFPFTFVTFDVHGTFKGRVPDGELTLRFHGGELADHEVVIPGMPRFEVGETYLLFVRNNGTTASPVVGWFQGQLRIAREGRSGEEILVDAFDRPVLGLQDGRFLFDDRRMAGPGEVAPGVRVLATEGVEIEPGEPPASAAAPRARTVTGQIAALVAARRARASFVPGRLVPSALPADVPDTVTARAVAPNVAATP
jgi:hypothetical protein